MSNLDAKANPPYSSTELNHFKQLLNEEEKETRKEIERIHNSLDDLQSNQSDENSAAAHHQGDIASDEDERERLLIALEKEDDKLDEITAALDRIEQGTYGICRKTGVKIQKERLEAIPYARFSVEAQKKEEN